MKKEKMIYKKIDEKETLSFFDKVRANTLKNIKDINEVNGVNKFNVTLKDNSKRYFNEAYDNRFKVILQDKSNQKVFESEFFIEIGKLKNVHHLYYHFSSQQMLQLITGIQTAVEDAYEELKSK